MGNKQHSTARSSNRLKSSVYNILFTSAALLGLSALPTAAAAEDAPGSAAMQHGKAPKDGPWAIIPSATYDAASESITLPLHQGTLKDGTTVWYIITEASDQQTAERIGSGFSNKLRFADVNNIVRSGWVGADGKIMFDKGGVDFSPARSLTPGKAPNFFPPTAFNIGALGDDDYTPLVKLKNAGDVILNAPTIAFNMTAEALNTMCNGKPDYSKVHDRVMKICPRDGTVTMHVSASMSAGHEFRFISTESNLDLVSVLEAATYAPRLKGLPHDGDDGAFSPVEQNYVVVNGQTGKDNPERQGINSAISDGLSVIDVFGDAPTLRGEYSPLWNIYPVVWNDKARKAGAVKRLHSESEVLDMVSKGYIGGLSGAFGPGGFNVNCPAVFRVN